jgi:hypothetical protein
MDVLNPLSRLQIQALAAVLFIAIGLQEMSLVSRLMFLSKEAGSRGREEARKKPHHPRLGKEVFMKIFPAKMSTE